MDALGISIKYLIKYLVGFSERVRKIDKKFKSKNKWNTKACDKLKNSLTKIHYIIYPNKIFDKMSYRFSEKVRKIDKSLNAKNEWNPKACYK